MKLAPPHYGTGGEMNQIQITSQQLPNNERPTLSDSNSTESECLGSGEVNDYPTPFTLPPNPDSVNYFHDSQTTTTPNYVANYLKDPFNSLPRHHLL